MLVTGVYCTQSAVSIAGEMRIKAGRYLQRGTIWGCKASEGLRWEIHIGRFVLVKYSQRLGCIMKYAKGDWGNILRIPNEMYVS